MKINLKNATNADTIHAVIRMNKAEYQALREYMHAEPGNDIWFPYGVSLVKHGYGWYYMAPMKANRAPEKMQFALKVIRAFLREEEEKTEAEIKRLMPLMVTPDVRVTSFSNAHSEGEWGYASERREAPRNPVPAAIASASKLQALASKFSKQGRA